MTELADWLEEVSRRAADLPDTPRAYLVITPLGIDRREWLAGELEQRDVAIGARLPLSPWPRISTALRLARKPRKDLERAAQFEAAWRALYPSSPGEAWAIPAPARFRIAAIKSLLRDDLPSTELTVGDRPAVLHAVHLADADEALLEARQLEAAIELLRAR